MTVIECVKDLVDCGVLNKRDLNRLKIDMGKVRIDLVDKLEDVMREIREYNESDIINRFGLEKI